MNEERDRYSPHRRQTDGSFHALQHRQTINHERIRYPHLAAHQQAVHLLAVIQDKDR